MNFIPFNNGGLMIKNNGLNRRNFLKKTSYGLGLGMLGASKFNPVFGSNSEKITRPPREVWVATITALKLNGTTMEQNTANMLRRMERVAPLKPDIICLPETFASYNIGSKKLLPIADKAETVPGPTTERFAKFAKKNNCYVICPIYTKKAGYIYNSAVLIDRSGNVVGQYDKIHLTNTELDWGIIPGPLDPPVFETDFGKIGIMICFDANWPATWAKLKKKGAEIIFFPSGFPGGKLINSLAWMNQYYIVTSIFTARQRIVDITGDELFNSGRKEYWLCAPVNLDKKLFHCAYNMQKMRDLRAKYRDKVKVKLYHPEGWFTIESRSSDITVDQIKKEFELTEYDDFIKLGTEYQIKKRR